MEHAQAIKVPGAGKPLVWDWLFLVLLVAALTGSAWVGVLAYREGMKPLRISGAMKVAAGMTTLAEVFKVAPPSERT